MNLKQQLFCLYTAIVKYTLCFSPSTVPFDMEPEILPEGAPVPLNNIGEESIKEYHITKVIHSCPSEPQTLVAKMGEPSDPP